MSKKILKINHYIEYYALKIISFIICILPERLALWKAKNFGTFLYYIIPLRKKIVLRNLSIAFPEKSEDDKRKIALKCYQHYAILFARFMRPPKLSEKYFRDKVINYDDAKAKAIEDFKDKGSIGLTAHFGDWEFLGSVLSFMGYPMTGVAKPMHNPLVDKYVIKMRDKKGLRMIETGGFFKKVVTLIKSKKTVVFIADQDARKDGYFEDFFGKPASTFGGPALFSLKLNLPIYPWFCVSIGGGKYKIIFKDPIFPPKECSDKEEAMREITRKHISVLEEVIREYPEQYFWFHRRWKTKIKKKK